MSTDTAGPTGHLDPHPSGEPGARINLPVFVPSAVVALAVTVWCVAAPDHALSTLEGVVGWVSTWFGWFYIALTTAVLIFVIYLGVSRYGSVRLGPEHSKPEFSTGAWAAMLFAAGIGTDLMFFAVYEPVTQYLTPPSIEGGTVTAAREATVWTLFHYGISGWGMYALMGMALAYFAYRMNLPLAVRSALFPLVGKRVDGPIGHTVDTAAVIGTIFGVATSLGIGVVSLNVGLNVVFGIPQGLATQSALIVLAVAIATVSAVSGIEKGIKRISQLNVLLAILLAVYVLVTGRTAYLLNALVLNVGDYARLFPDMTMQTFAYEDTGDWMSFWTLFFWAWWIAWAAFVGLFLARISRGRTIKQFVAGTMIIPFSYILMWVAIFGNAAIGEIRSGNTDFAEAAAEAVDPSEGLWSLLQEYPAFPVVASLAILVGLLFYVTSADSGALVMGNLTSRLRTVNDDADLGAAGLLGRRHRRAHAGHPGRGQHLRAAVRHRHRRPALRLRHDRGDVGALPGARHRGPHGRQPQIGTAGRALEPHHRPRPPAPRPVAGADAQGDDLPERASASRSSSPRWSCRRSRRSPGSCASRAWVPRWSRSSTSTARARSS